jgi:hypothetical protein
VKRKRRSALRARHRPGSRTLNRRPRTEPIRLHSRRCSIPDRQQRRPFLLRRDLREMRHERGAEAAQLWRTTGPIDSSRLSTTGLRSARTAARIRGEHPNCGLISRSARAPSEGGGECARALRTVAREPRHFVSRGRRSPSGRAGLASRPPLENRAICAPTFGL